MEIMFCWYKQSEKNKFVFTFQKVKFYNFQTSENMKLGDNVIGPRPSSRLHA